MKILVLTDMFPSKEDPTLGIFVQELTNAIANKNQVVVIYPQIWNPLSIKPYKTSMSPRSVQENKNVFARSVNDEAISKEEILRSAQNDSEQKVRDNDSKVSSEERNGNYHSQTNGIEVYRPKLFIPPKGDRLFFRTIAFFLVAFPLIKNLAKKFHFDLIHAHMACPAGFVAVLLGMILRKPVIVTAHGSDIHSFPQYFFLKHLIRFTLKRATKIVAVSWSLKDLIMKIAGSQKNLLVIRNGTKPEKFFPMDKMKTRQMFNLPTHEKIILCISSLTPTKGIDILLRAFADINDGCSNLMILGKGELELQLKTLAKDLHIENRVFFIGSRNHDEIPLWLNACDVLCLSSHCEGFPTVIVEAFACGKPVVATKVGGVPEAVANESLGILVEPGNKEELALALHEALKKEWNHQAIAEYGKRFSWDAIADEYLELYKNVVSKNGMIN